MSAIETLLSRRSVSALQAPAPDGKVLERILECALRAPDHGRLRPWRFILLRDAGLTAFADLTADAFRRRDPTANDDAVARQRTKMMRAPLLIGLVAKIVPNHKIPEDEQLLSAGAASMNLLNAVHAEGFAGVWITGANCYDPTVQAALGVEAPERLIGFLFVGTSSSPILESRRPALEKHVTEWTGVPAGP